MTLRLGITGTVAAGKSRVAGLLRSRGAFVLDADALGHETRQRPEIAAALRAALGADDRRELARLVFADPAARATLEGILHPAMRAAALTRLAESAAPVVAIDAAVLLESRWELPLDLILCVDAERGERQRRAETRGWDAAEFARREAAQWPAERKRAGCGVLLLNNHWPAARRVLDALADAWGLPPALSG